MENEINILEDGDFEKPQTVYENLKLGMLIGRLQMAKAVEKTVNVFSFSQWAYIKQSKIYRDLKGQQLPNGTVLTGTWEEVCKLAGTTRVTVEELLLNHENLTTEAAEALENAGVSVRQMRTLRQLPDDQKTALIEAAKAGDKDQLLDLAETLIEKHQKEKSTLEAKAKLLEADMEEERKRRDRIEKTLNDTESRLETSELTLKMATRGEGLALVTRNIRSESMANASLIGYACDEITRQWELAESEAALNDADKTARERAVLMAISAALEAVTMMYESISSRTQIAMPLLPEAFDDLTQAERQATVHSYERVKEQFELVKIKRKSEDYADHVADGGEKKRGRPAGSKNKDA